MCILIYNNNSQKMNENMKGEETYVENIIEVQNLKTKAVDRFQVKIQYIPATREINISRAICSLHSRGLHIENCQFFYQDVDRRVLQYIGTYPFPSHILVKYQNFPDNIIRLKYKKVGQPDSPKNQKKQRNAPKNKNSDRTIGQVIEMVKKWRNLWSQLDIYGKRCYTLESAAQEIGVTRRTLEDYNYQIQQGQSFSFDFQKHKNQKIGVLRQFNKMKRQEMNIINNTDNYWVSSDSDEDKNRR